MVDDSKLVFEKLTQLCKGNGFHKRGNAFFRHHGDGVLQVMLYKQRTMICKHIDLDIGLFSLYGEIEPQWLTSSGCIPRYTARWLEPGIREKVIDAHRSGGDWEEIQRAETYSINLAFTEACVIPFFDSILTQSQLAEGICYLDIEGVGPRKGRVRWNDALKIAPFLHCGDYGKAILVIDSILNQHEQARQWRQEHFSQEQYRLFIAQMREEDKYLHELKALAENNDCDTIMQYLQANYRKNIQLGKFLTK